MADFGPTSVTKTITQTEFNYNTPLFLNPMKDENTSNTSTEGQSKGSIEGRDFREVRTDNNHTPSPELAFKTSSGERNLDDSKDSDEGFSSSFSPTSSDPQMLQEQTTTANAAFWGTTREDFVVPSFQMGGSSGPLIHNASITPANSPFLTNSNSRKGIPQPPVPYNNSSHIGHQRRPYPALSTFLASNKAMANALGVSNWNANPNPVPPSAWSSQPSNNNFTSNWPQPNKQQLPFPISSNSPNRSASKNSPFPIISTQTQVKSIKTKPSLPSSLNVNPISTSSKTGMLHLGGLQTQNSVSSHSGLDMTIVDDITQLTNTFSNLTTSNEGSSNGLFPSQDRRDMVKYSALEPQLLDMISRSPIDSQDHHLPSYRYPLQRKGFHHHHHHNARDTDQIVPSLNSSLNGSPRSDLDILERFSRKVFVGGLPPDIDEDEIHASFCRFGHLSVDWPHKAESKSYFPPKGYAFLLYKDELSVQRLIEACMMQDGKLYLCVSSPTIKDKPVQIRPWNLGDADFVMDGSQPLDPRKTIFVGGVPRPLRAVELAMIMDRLYGGVCYAGIDVDPELKYPKGAGRVAFSNQQSYIAAISARFIQLQHGDIDKRVEVKPYVLDDQMCDECHGLRCNGKFAPFFCSNITCLQYYCEQCWAIIHSRPGREFHKPLVKEGGDRPRHSPMSFRW